ncbi:MAG: LysR family transcriptional regulator [Bdellovibrionales bacterium]
MYNYNHLYYFYITAKSGGVSKAAKHLRISQPSLSSQLKVLEGQLNVKLFQKVGRANQLTRSGTAVYGFCRQMFEVSEQMSESILQRLPSVKRRIHIGVSDEVERSFVVEVVSHFLKNQKVSERPKISIVAGTQSQLAERLKFRELDIIVTEIAMSDPDLMNLSRIEAPVVLVSPSRWKVRNIRGIATIKEIMRENIFEWIMPSNKFKLRSEIDRFFEENELEGRIVLESDVMASLIRSVSDGIGVGFFPLLYLDKEVRGKSLRLLGPKGGFWKYRLWLVCSHQSQSDVLIQSFAKAFKEVGDNSI